LVFEKAPIQPPAVLESFFELSVKAFDLHYGETQLCSKKKKLEPFLTEHGTPGIIVINLVRSSSIEYGSVYLSSLFFVSGF